MEKISIVLATYNGEKFIYKQLLSLLQQTRKADEVLICDDGSSDNTVAIVQQFISSHGLYNWKLLINSRNLGWRKNFLQLFFLAHGDIIFYCDQDDIWSQNKIELMVQKIEERNDILCLACHYYSIDMKGDLVDYSVDQKSKETSTIKKIGMDNKRYFYPPSGCTMAFRKSLLKFIDQNYYSCNPDAIISRTAAVFDGLFYYDRNLMYHRFHSNNASINKCEAACVHGSSNLEMRKIFLEETIGCINMTINILGESDCYDTKNKYLKEIVKFLNQRKKILNNNISIINIFKLLRLCKNKTYFLLVISDTCYVLGINKHAGKFYKLFQ